MRAEIPRLLNNPLLRVALAMSVLATPACAKESSQFKQPVEAIQVAPELTKPTAVPAGEKDWTIDNEATEFAIRRWLGFLNQQVSYGIATQGRIPLDMVLEADYKYAKWDNNMKEIVLTNTAPIQDPIVIKLDANRIPSSVNSSNIAWRKYGEVQFKDISINEIKSNILSDVQKKGGLNWDGFVNLKFTTIYKIVTETLDEPANTQAIKTWAKGKPKYNLPNFSEPVSDKWEVRLQKKQEKWIPTYLTGLSSPEEIIISTPSDYVTNILNGSVCKDTLNVPCYNVKVRL